MPEHTPHNPPQKPYQQAMMSRLLAHEGSYINYPKDPAGATHYGITQATYDAYQKRLGLSVQSVKHITMAEVLDIYQRQYQDPIRFHDLPTGLDYALFDFAVNSGTSRAVRYLQRILNVRVDGALIEMLTNRQ
ncbi:MAG: glycosyl hydrolase 108 family protein [Cardiobacteriaceae bacterium]|nr:glycosyl hydrolase 108 family protein [Cardiobacteriaceae bacterium]